MKHALMFFAIVAASMSYSTTVLSAEKSTGMPYNYDQSNSSELKSQKDECLIVAKNCFGGDDTVMKRAERLNREIEKGTAVYTPEELKNLQNQLNWINSESENYSVDRY